MDLLFAFGWKVCKMLIFLTRIISQVDLAMHIFPPVHSNEEEMCFNMQNVLQRPQDSVALSFLMNKKHFTVTIDTF